MTARSRLKQPGSAAIRIRHDLGRRLDRIVAEQLSRAAEQRAHLGELLLQRGFGHGHTLPTLFLPHNSPSAEAAGASDMYRYS